MRAFLPLLVVAAGLTGRAFQDKLLAIQGGAAAVASWAQLSSLVDLVAGVSLAGIGVALVAVVARTPAGGQLDWLRASMLPAMGLSAVAGLLAWPAMHVFGGYVVPPGRENLAGLALMAGWLTVPPGLAVAVLIGMGRPLAAAGLTALSFIPPLTLLLVQPMPHPTANLLAGQILAGALVGAWVMMRSPARVAKNEMSQLLRFAPAGIAIGVLSPIAMLMARARIGDVLSWEQVAAVQTVWRANEWTTAAVAGVLYVHYLPRLSAATTRQAFIEVLRRSMLVTLIPALLAMAVLWLFLPQVVGLLFSAGMAPPREEAVYLILGDWLRMAAWVSLYGLYARNAPRAVTVGEILSVPLFALLVWFSPWVGGVAGVGLDWASAYLAYAVFNAVALREALRDSTWSQKQPQGLGARSA